jgi:hypothetical protein
LQALSKIKTTQHWWIHSNDETFGLQAFGYETSSLDLQGNT